MSLRAWLQDLNKLLIIYDIYIAELQMDFGQFYKLLVITNDYLNY